MSQLTTCKVCNHEVAKNAAQCVNCGAPLKQPFYKKWWVWAIVAALAILIAVQLGINNRTYAGQKAASTDAETVEESSSSLKSSSSSSKSISSSKSTSSTKVSASYSTALLKAKQYSNVLHMSKQRIFDQLRSKYGGNYSAAAARYAVEHVGANWNQNALLKARDYKKNLNLSNAAIRKQLTSKYGGKFTASQASYAISHLQ